MAGDDRFRKDGVPEDLDIPIEDDLDGWGAANVDIDSQLQSTFSDKTPPDGFPAQPRRPAADPGAEPPRGRADKGPGRRTTAPLPAARGSAPAGDSSPALSGSFPEEDQTAMSDNPLLAEQQLQPPAPRSPSQTLPLPGAMGRESFGETLPLGMSVPDLGPLPEEPDVTQRIPELAPEPAPEPRRAKRATSPAQPVVMPVEPPPAEPPPVEAPRPRKRPTSSTAPVAPAVEPAPAAVRTPRVSEEQAADLPPPPIDPIPLDGPLPEGDSTWLTSFQTFKLESQKLARAGNWRRLAAVTALALLRAPYSRRMTRSSLLLDLARIYRDRLSDEVRAEQAFAILAEEDPANSEATNYLVELYEKRGEWGDAYDLYLKSVEATWDPNERLACTRLAADLATQQLHDMTLAIKAWELLWNLGDAVEEASRELTSLYRLAGRWVEMATFLEQQASRQEGPQQLVTLRELAEVKLSGMRDPDGASKVLEQIVDRSPKDPIATLQLARVYAQRKDWAAIDRLGQQAAAKSDVPPAAALDLQHLVADSLWQAGRLEQAIAAYDRILKVDPADHDGTTRKQEFLTRTSRFSELLGLLVGKADSTEDDEERAGLLASAAELAEEKLRDPDQAAKLWERRITIDAEHLRSFEALARLYETMTDLRGVARALEGQLALTRETRARIKLLGQLGEHYAARMSDDDRAEGCWKETLSLDPTDISAREELIKLHRRRGDFESLNSALLRQIWLTTDLQRAERLCRAAAENIDDNFKDPARSVEAWRRVLDFSPADLQALRALAKHYAALGRKREVIATLEQEIRAVDDPETKIDRGLQIARLWSEEGNPKAAAAAYERILHWDSINTEALSGLVQIYRENKQEGKAIAALEHAGTLLPPARRIELLRLELELIPPDDHAARFFHLRRILRLADSERGIVEELKPEAEAANLWPEMAALLVQLACQQSSMADRLELLKELAWVCEKKLDSRVRALLALQGVFFAPEHQGQVLEEVVRLARQTKRFEDLLAILDRMTTPEFDLERRKDVIRQRASICEKDIHDLARAFQELRRLIELDPVDWAPLAELERLAGENNLWPQLDAVYAELLDRTTGTAERLDLLARREKIARDKLGSRQRAFDLLVQRYRLDVQDLGLLRQLTEDAEALQGWDWLLPLLEATQLYAINESSAKELSVTAALYEGKLQNREHAFSLYAVAFVMRPEESALADKLVQLADQTSRHELLADTFRAAAATSKDHTQTVDLLRRIATIYEKKLDAAARAIDVHRRLLALREDEMRSLEVMIDWHRSRNEWRDLRDRLTQWVRLAPADQDRVPKLLEIASISERYLRDAEAALETYGQVLEINAQHEVARQGLNGLVVAITEPGLRLRWLRMELKSAVGSRATELRLEIAQIQEEDLGDTAAAVQTLRELLGETGVDGPGFGPLSRLLRDREQWKDLVVLLQSKAAGVEGEAAKLAALEEAIGICHEHVALGEEPLREDLYRSLLKLRPADREIRVLLARLLRQAGRFEELCALLEENLQHLTDVLDRVATLYELARVKAQNLGQPADALAAWQRVRHDAPHEEGAVLALARAAMLGGDIKAYVAFRQQQAKQLPPHEAALVLCHLAEIADENEVIAEMMIPLYREARGLDPNNMPAMEALKGIGRRLKNLRPAAALLPLEGERALPPLERAKRLRALGDDAMNKDAKQALEWYHRAAAVDPDDPGNWAALAEALDRMRVPAGVYRARLAWLQALERTERLSPVQLRVEAERLYQVALSAKAAEKIDVYNHRIHQAYDLVPGHAPSALATAQALIDTADFAGAHKLLHTILTQHQAELSDDQRMVALYSRGLTLRALGKSDQAMDDIRAALRLQPLHAEALIALGEMQATSGRVAAALEHQIRALMVVQDPGARARLYYRLGVLWEDGLGAKEEAGACYELALADNLTERDLYHRSLRHFQRTGRLDQSLEVVNGLLPTATDPEELATLWLVRGEIYAARPGSEDQAVEAFDMALSYDPTRQEARDGLTIVLERRGDWQQLIQVLEATCDVGTPHQQSIALQRMADICSLQLGDPERAEQYLRRSVSVFPTREALEQLERIFTVESGRLVERREILGRLVSFGPPWFERCLELSKMLLAEEKPWAWCLLSPLLGVSQVDPDIKAVVQAMRKEYERPPVLVPKPEDYALLRPPTVPEQLTAVIAEMGRLLRPLGIATLDQAGDGGAIAIGEGTSLGKTFATIAEAAGLAGCTLYRTAELPESVCIVNAEPSPMVVVRTEVMQQLVHAEVGFLFSYSLELARPGHRVMAALSKDNRDQLLPALWLALGFVSGAGKLASKLADRIKEVADESLRASWAERLVGLRGVDPVEQGRAWWQGVCSAARRAGLLAGADLRQVFRVASRLEPDVPRPRVVARLDELDEYIGGSELLQDLVAFAANPAFGQLMKGAQRAIEP